MLRVTQQDSAAAAKRYFATADYYAEGQETVGRWGGQAAERLGLEGTVDKQAFDRLCDNLHPATGARLTARNKSERTVGYDFTFSVPKSVSLLYATTGDGQILGAFRSAVDETMREVEAEMKTRVRKGKRDEDRATGNMVWAEFVHTTSRPLEDGVPDPHLHAHVFALNATFCDQEQRWKAGQFRGLKADAPYFQAAFRARLANNLEDLGFGLERKRDDFEVAGVPAALIKKFSRRTEEIERVAVEQGITDPDRKGELGAKTRQKKAPGLTPGELRQRWGGRMTAPERHALEGAYRRATPYARPARGEGAAVTHAIEHCYAREAVVSERKLLTEALKRGVGAVTVGGVKDELARRPLVRAERDGRVMATTPDMLGKETRLVAYARGGRGKYRPLGDPDRPCTRDWFNAGQKAAVRHVLGSRDAVTVVRGIAGTGKTTLEQEVGEALAEAGRPVVALAQSTGAVDVLRTEAGFGGAATLAAFFKDTRMQEAARGGVVLLDEASQVGTADLLRLFDVARDVGGRVVLVGDRRQHRSVSAGEPLKLLEERAGLPVAEVTEILRQAGDYKRACELLAGGDTAAGFTELDRLGWVKEVPDAGRYQALADAYLAAAAERKRGGEFKTALVVSPTHAEAARITRAIREAMKADGRLAGERALDVWLPANLTDAQKSDPVNIAAGDLLQFHQNAPGIKNGARMVVAEGQQLPLRYAGRFEVYRPARLALAAGDRIRVTANGKTKDGKHRLTNGSLLTLRGFTPRGDLVVDRGWVIAREFGHLAQGYVVTSHASQGKTVDKVIIGQSSASAGAANRRQFYVSVSRGREQALVFTDSKEELLKAVRRADEPLSATELARPGRRRPALRQRLRKHLAFLHRLGTFARTHEPLHAERHREMGHGR